MNFSSVARMLISGLIGFLFVMLVTKLVSGNPYDSTDGIERSGLTIHTDCLTSRQYLSTGRGGLTPRIGRDGLQIVTKVESTCP